MTKNGSPDGKFFGDSERIRVPDEQPLIEAAGDEQPAVSGVPLNRFDPLKVAVRVSVGSCRWLWPSSRRSGRSGLFRRRWKDWLEVPDQFRRAPGFSPEVGQVVDVETSVGTTRQQVATFLTFQIEGSHGGAVVSGNAIFLLLVTTVFGSEVNGDDFSESAQTEVVGSTPANVVSEL